MNAKLQQTDGQTELLSAIAQLLSSDCALKTNKGIELAYANVKVLLKAVIPKETEYVLNFLVSSQVFVPSIVK